VNSNDITGRLTPLPVQPRPLADEPASSYVRRLALANHLRPSYLHRYLAGPPTYLGAIRPGRLAILTGRSITILERTLTGLPRPDRDATLVWQPPRHVTRAGDLPALHAAIRRDAQHGDTIRILASRYRMNRRTIRQALDNRAPPPRRQSPRRGPALGHLHDPITAMLASEPSLTSRQIWERLVDDHAATICYATVRQYVSTRLRPPPAGRDPQA
jgi:hypothetical protein